MSLNALLNPRICELGKIKIGGKEKKVRTTSKGGTWRAPVKYDHFVITNLSRDNLGDLEHDAALMKSLADAGYADKDGQLRRLPIYLLSNDIEDVMQSAYVWYGGKTVGARSDGEKVTWFCDSKNGKRLAQPLEEDWESYMLNWTNSKGQKLFKLHSVFNCVIANSEGRWGGVYKLRTTSRITADQLYGSLVHLQQLTGGILIGMPLQLVVRPLQVAPNGISTTVYVVHVELRGADLMAIQNKALQIAQHQASHAQQMLIAKTEYRRMLGAPGEETDPNEINDIETEFLPPEEVEGEAAENSNGGRENVRVVKPGPNRLRNLIDAGQQPSSSGGDIEQNEGDNAQSEPQAGEPVNTPDAVDAGSIVENHDSLPVGDDDDSEII